MRLELSVLSKPGGRKVNEDACGLWSNPPTSACFAVIADGAGGHRGGETASRLVVETVLAFFRDHPEPNGDGALAAARAANEAVMNMQRAEAALSDMRATVVALAIDAASRHASWVHVGDSRLYVFRAGTIVAQTRDQSVVQSMIDAGYVAADQLRVAPNRSTLLAAIGDPAAFEYAHLERCDLVPGDRLLLCTDGWWEYIEESELADLASRSASTEVWLRDMESLVASRAKVTHDNYSAIAIACDA
jgi:serine/threonine protein phosphatase PrpC